MNAKACAHNFLGSSTCEHCGVDEHDHLVARAEKAEAEVEQLVGGIVVALAALRESCYLPEDGETITAVKAAIPERLRTTAATPGEKT